MTVNAGVGIADHEAMTRLLKPRSIAVVGLSDSSGFRDYIRPTLDSDAEIFFVHPKHDTVLGHPTHPSLTSIGRPIDAVISVMAAERTTALVEEAAAGLDIGGMVSIAGGFAEMNEAGAALQDRLVIAAQRTGMPLIGPNGLGYINVPRRISLTIASPHKRRPGGISVVSQSGALLSGVAMAAWNHPGCGLNLLISAGNEAVTDLADYVDFLAADPDTRAIGLVVEKIRRPEAFFAAARRATEAGKPIAVLKLARSKRSQRMAASHTGALTGDAWVYDVALGQAGIAVVADPEELVDRLALFEQLDPANWSAVESLGVISMTGGFASLSVDLAEADGMAIPPLTALEPWVHENIPGVTVANPLDTTGMGASLWPEVVRRYATCPDSDALLYIHPLADEDGSAGTISLVEEFVKAAQNGGKPFVVANCSGALGSFVTDRLPAGKVAAGRGLRPTLRGLQTLGAFVRHREKAFLRPGNPPVPALPRPDLETVALPEGRMLPFGPTLEMLSAAGIPVAPYHLIAPDAAPGAVLVPFGGPYVVKLADVGHRTEHGAVRLGVSAGGLADTVAELRTLAADHKLSPVVVVQPQVEILGEAFIGVQAGSELGPLVVFGLGGVFVEVLNRVGGRMAPLGMDDARSLIAEFADTKVMHGFRGRPGWDLEALAGILVAAGRLAVAGRGWIESLDLNPLVYSPSGFLAVDALCLVRDEDDS
ncbi:acetate--CoA ligase family protein [Acrocarpospora sp. B8E8]|uniref:acetate--CoA ligase family protein n=1 Tax=Acrocarpospora sp. B8E8 TaxID=3153572 RepID=UPI00325CA4FC